MNKIQSMTGFGSEEKEINRWNYRCEIRSLNSRFVEVNIRMPRSFICIEPQLIANIKNVFCRGKIDVFIEVTNRASEGEFAQLNPASIEHYVKLVDQLHTQIISQRPKNFTLDTKHTLQEFLTLPNLLLTNKTDLESAEEQQNNIINIVYSACMKLQSSRETEGSKLKTALQDLVSQISESRLSILSQVSDLRTLIHDNYIQRLNKLILDMEKNGIALHIPPQERIVSEISYLLDKADIEEELTRLQSHEVEFLKTLDSGKDVGRKLDFLCQEFHREVNTISSKIQFAQVQDSTLKMKQSIERIRQQVQNIE